MIFKPAGGEIAFPPPPNLKSFPPQGFLAATWPEAKALMAQGPIREEGAFFGPGFGRYFLAEGYFIAGPFLGGPMAVMMLEELARRGAEKIIFTGLAGSLGELGAGEILAPSSGLSTEGASAHYPAPLTPDPTWHGDFLARNPETKSGPVWSTDAIYRETAPLVARQKALGALAVDMESCALLAAANFRGLKFLALLLISDIIEKDRHFWAFKEKSFKKGLSLRAEKAHSFISSPPLEIK